MRVWAEYFLFADIYGIDVFDKKPHDSARIHTRIIDQKDIASRKALSDECGGFDIIIDDGSHLCEHVVKSFAGLFPLLKQGGIYAIEDLQTSYWPSWQSNTTESSMELIKRLADGINYREWLRPGYEPSYTDQNIVAIHVYHSLVFIEKGPNWESSNIVTDNMPNKNTV